MAEAARERGPRQVAGSSDTFLAEAGVPGGRYEAVVGSRIWGCGSVSSSPAHLLGLPLEGLCLHVKSICFLRDELPDASRRGQGQSLWWEQEGPSPLLEPEAGEHL